MKSSFHLLTLVYLLSSTALSCFLLIQQHLVINIFLAPALVGILFAINFLPKVLFIPFGGLLADRLPKRKTLITTNVVRLVLMALAWLLSANGELTLYTLYAISFFFGLMDAIFIPCANSCIPSLVQKDQLKKANAQFTAANQLGVILGPLIGALAIDYVSTQLSLLLICSLVLACSVFSVNLNIQHTSTAGSKSGVLQSMLFGLQLAKQLNRKGELSILAAVSFFFTGVLIALSPILAVERFGASAQHIGLLNASFGVGVIAFTLFIRFSKQSHSPNLFRSAATLGGLIIALAVLEHYFFILAIYFFMGSVVSSINVSVITNIQRSTPAAHVGQALSMAIFASQALLPVSFGLISLLTQLNLSINQMITVYGTGLLLTVSLQQLCGIKVEENWQSVNKVTIKKRLR